ncbi:MAG: hypothetical protein SchgKO_19670 [Schleiferiaceae bacterium]
MPSCVSSEKEERLRVFENTIGAEPSEVLTETATSFDQFLSNSYPELSDEKDRIQAFLSIYSDTPFIPWEEINPHLPSKDYCVRLLEKWEQSGLRKEIRTYPYEEENTTEDFGFEAFDSGNHDPKWDSIPEFNYTGKYLQALFKVGDLDSCIHSYADAKRAAGDISSPLLAGGLLTCNREEWDTPVFKRILLAEFYWYMLRRKASEE